MIRVGKSPLTSARAYNDTAPLLGANTAQGAIDKLKTYANVYTYREGETSPEGKLFASFAAAVAAANAAVLVGAVPAIHIDGSKGAPVSGTGLGVLDFSAIDFIGEAFQPFTVQTGTSFRAFRKVDGVSLLSTSTTPACKVVGSVGLVDFLLVTFIDAAVNGGTLAPFFEVDLDPDDPNGYSFLQLFLYNAAYVQDGAFRAVQVNAGCYGIGVFFDGACCSPTAWGGNGEVDLYVNSPSCGNLSQGPFPLTQANVTGSFSLTFAPRASQTSYTPASAANWNNSAPTTVAAALDRIAAKITPIP